MLTLWSIDGEKAVRKSAIAQFEEVVVLGENTGGAQVVEPSSSTRPRVPFYLHKIKSDSSENKCHG